MKPSQLTESPAVTRGPGSPHSLPKLCVGGGASGFRASGPRPRLSGHFQYVSEWMS